MPSSSFEFTDTICSAQERMSSTEPVSIGGKENDNNDVSDHAERLIRVIAKIDDTINPSEMHFWKFIRFRSGC